MAASSPLQAKANLLGVIMVVFTLFALPMFTQVKVDTKESAKEANQTFLVQLFKDVQQNIEIDPDRRIDVEDAWGNQAKKDNPGCTECDPQGDPDEDGLTNEEELAQGRNPMCNEEVKGEDYCRARSNTELPDEDELPPEETRYDLLFQDNLTVTTQQSRVFSAGYNYDRFLVYMNGTTTYEGYNVTLMDAQEQILAWAERDGDFFGQQENPRDYMEPADPPTGDYTFLFQNIGGSIVPGQGPPIVRVVVYGVLEPSAGS